MGFSVSGSAAIIFLAAFVGFGILYTSAYNSFELVDTALDEKESQLLGQQNTDLEIVSAEINNSESSLRVTVENTGAKEMRVNNADLLINGTYQETLEKSVDGESGRSLWLPGENLTIEMEYNGGPARLKIIADHGVADVQEVND